MNKSSNAPWLRGVRGEQVLPLINSDDATLRVPAGPGTGKTFGLRKRVLRLLHPDGLAVEPDHVVVCTFNRVIRDDLAQAIAEELEPYGIETPPVRTVHGLSAELAIPDVARFLLPQEQEAMVYDIRVTEAQIKERYPTQVDAMRALREHEAGLATHTSLAVAVREWLADHHAELVGELPRRIQTRLEGGDFEDKRYDHVIVDEFQDLTEVEARLVLTSEPHTAERRDDVARRDGKPGAG
jgi:DNA helicase-2/ATP-dependent DNA helicase PcrA